MRVFIGFFIPPGPRERLVELQKRVAKLPVSCKMVEPENLHVCLSFLGNVRDDGLDNMVVKLEKICSNCEDFDVDVEDIKLIPSKSYVRVVALGASSESGGLEKIASDVSKRFSKCGGKSHPPHVTLCRVGGVVDKVGFLKGVESLGPIGIKFHVNSLSLIKSELGGERPIYSTVKEVAIV